MPVAAIVRLLGTAPLTLFGHAGRELWLDDQIGELTGLKVIACLPHDGWQYTGRLET